MAEAARPCPWPFPVPEEWSSLLGPQVSLLASGRFGRSVSASSLLSGFSQDSEALSSGLTPSHQTGSVTCFSFPVLYFIQKHF